MTLKSIMIIDDNEGDHFLTTDVIEEFDPSIEISNAYDGEEALEMLRNMDVQPCTIILDINMPRMNGFEFLEEYSKFPEKSPVTIMLTSSAQEQDKNRAMAFDLVKKYCLKPISVEDLKEICADMDNIKNA